MNRNDQAVAVVPDIEDDKAIDIVRIRKTRSQFLKITPSRRFHNPDPGAEFLSRIPMGLRRLQQAFDSDDMHYLEYFATCEESRESRDQGKRVIIQPPNMPPATG